MRRLFIVAVLCLASTAAHAQYRKVVPSGKPLMLYRATSVNPDCSASGVVTMRIMEAPEHGRITIRRARLFPTYPESNPRHHCNQRRVESVQAVYTSHRDYTGSDHMAIEIFFPAGQHERHSFGVSVR